MRRFLEWARDARVILGLALFGFLLLEGAYRLQGAARRQVRQLRAPSTEQSRPAHPYADQAWWHAARAHGNQGFGLRFDAYRGWWVKPFSSPYLNIDSAGFRLTPQAPVSRPARRVFMMGGSTMWGYTSRDSMTIPALVAARLRARGFSDIEVVNLAQSAAFART
jgi:hypothetical protein